MAHELDHTKAGTGAMFSVGQTPWHKEGHVLTKAPSFEEALRIAELDYVVALRPLHFMDREGRLPATDSGFAVVRTDREERGAGSVLAIVGDAYSVIQNREAFEVLEPLLDAGAATLETGGALRGGRDAWLLVKFNIDDARVREVFADEVVPFGVVHTSHGLRKAVIMETPVRVVCANTLAAAYRSKRAKETAVGIVHRGGARVRLVEAAQDLFGGIVERYRMIADAYAAMKERILTVEEFTRSVLDPAAPLPTDGTLPGFKRSMEAAQEKRFALATLWERGRGHTGDHSAWEAFNGAAEALDHDVDRFRVRGSRVESMMSGGIAAKKEQIADSLLALCVSRN